MVFRLIRSGSFLWILILLFSGVHQWLLSIRKSIFDDDADDNDCLSRGRSSVGSSLDSSLMSVFGLASFNLCLASASACLYSVLVLIFCRPVHLYTSILPVPYWVLEFSLPSDQLRVLLEILAVLQSRQRLSFNVALCMLGCTLRVCTFIHFLFQMKNYSAYICTLYLGSTSYAFPHSEHCHC